MATSPQILIGTASWTDKSLLESKRFYPPEAKSPELRLRHYAANFPIVEVDSSYYALPSPANSALWVERTPDRFVFNVKAFRLCTGHHTLPAVLPKDLQATLGANAGKTLYYKDASRELKDEVWRRFREALEPLRSAGKLGLVHLQFPPWFVRNSAAHDHILECQRELAGFNVSVEFRNRTWFEDGRTRRTLDFLSSNRLVHTIVDEPQGFASSIPAVWNITHQHFALVRLHGRNAATWEKKGLLSSAERFDYLYAEAELNDLAQQIEKLEGALQLHVVFNNNRDDQGIVGARRLKELLHGSRSKHPESIEAP